MKNLSIAVLGVAAAWDGNGVGRCSHSPQRGDPQMADPPAHALEKTLHTCSGKYS
jgi:hypothetical protein